MKRIFLLLIVYALMFSCQTSKQLTQKDVSIDNFLSNEWISFDIKWLYYVDGKLKYEPVDSKVIIHNANDTTREIAVFDNNYYSNTATMLNSERAILVDNSYGFISHQVYKTEPYNEIAMSTLQNLMNYFPMYFPHDYASIVTYSDSTLGYTINIDNDTIYIIPATITEKLCYGENYCELINSSLELGYSTKYKTFVQAKEVKKWYEGDYYNEYEISNIDFGNKENFLDSVFDIKGEQWKDYEIVSANEFLPTQYACSNRTVNDSVLNYPLINVFSGDTITLGEMNGCTLLHYFSLTYDKEYFEKVNNGSKNVVDNCIWLMPHSANINKIKDFAQKNNMGKNVYYAKDFKRYYLYGLKNVFLFDKKHQIIGTSRYISGDVNKWINKILKKNK